MPRRSTIGSSLARQWAMLQLVPRQPVKVTASVLADALARNGYTTTVRTIERDLKSLQSHFPLIVDDREKPYGWSWMRSAAGGFAPRLGVGESLAVQVARRHLDQLLPASLAREFDGLAAAASRALATTEFFDWADRIAVVPTSLALLPPAIDPRIIGTVHEALQHQRVLTALYSSRASGTRQRLVIHPLGVIVRGPILLLVCCLFDYRDVRQLALHRMSDVMLGDAPRREPEGFQLQHYAATDGRHLQSHGPILLVAQFALEAAEHLAETPLSSDQTLRPLRGGDRVEVRATVEDDLRLRWWLLGFGRLVTVKAPARLARWHRSEFSKAVATSPINEAST